MAFPTAVNDQITDAEVPAAAADPARVDQRVLQMPLALFVFAILYGGMVCIAGVLGAKQVSLGTWPSAARGRGRNLRLLILLVVLSSAVAELYGRTTADRLVRLGFVPLLVSMALIQFVLRLPGRPTCTRRKHAFADRPWPELPDDARRPDRLWRLADPQRLHLLEDLGPARADGRLVWLRGMVASFLSQIVDTLLFITIAFYGDFPICPMLGPDGRQDRPLDVMVPPLSCVRGVCGSDAVRSQGTGD